MSGKNIDKNLLRLYESLYVKISLGLERFKTKLVPLSSSPLWGETSLLPRQTESESLLILHLFARSERKVCPVPVTRSKIRNISFNGRVTESY